jgi:ubiquinone biosynthesis protein COQ4
MHRLLADPDHTEYAFDVIDALDGDWAERVLQQMLRQRQGLELLLERPCLADHLNDRKKLASMPEGSLGRAYLDHLDRYGLDPLKLVEIGQRRKRDDPVLDWCSVRQELAHDLWHVLSGCGADAPGEAELLAFSFAQNGGRANLFLTLGAAARVWSWKRWSWPLEVWRSWRKGSRALQLSALPYEDLLPLPLDDVRRAVGIPPASRA